MMGRCFVPVGLTALAGAVAAFARGAAPRFAAGLLLMVVAWLGYVVHVGGDFFPDMSDLMRAYAMIRNPSPRIHDPIVENAWYL